MFFEWHNVCKVLYSWSFKLEPLSIISVIFQLASAAPQIDQFLSHEDNKVYSRTETIEIYRKNMNIDVYKNNSD